ncbi:MAG: MBL fold metallo-hydrolase [Thermodesulfobacteriota bacterium]
MKKNTIVLILLTLHYCCCLFPAAGAEAACRNPNLVLWADPYIHPVVVPAAVSSGFVEISWFGHAFFQFITSSGTRIATDPFSRHVGYTIPEVWPHVVTVGRDSGNHNNVDLVKGEPLVLWGVKSWEDAWQSVNTTFRDVLIYNVPIHTRAPHEFVKGASFVYEMDGMCVCHTGDIGEPFNEDQLDLIGHVDILLVPIGWSVTIGPETAKKVVEQLKPRIVIPMHYYNRTALLQRFLDGSYPVRFLESNTFSVSRDTLPPATEIYIPKVVWYGREDER